MKNPDSLVNLKKSLKVLPQEEMMELVLRLTKYKKENKELLTYLVSYEADPQALCVDYKDELTEAFEELNTHPYYAAKGMRKMLKLITQFRRFTKSTEFTIDLQAHFIRLCMEHLDGSLRHRAIQNIIYRQLARLHKDIGKLHEDLRFDYAELPKELATEIHEHFRFWSDFDFPLHPFAEDHEL